MDVEQLWSAARDHLGWLFAGLVGRMMFHTREAQAGRRRFWGRELPFELLVAVGMGMIGYAICSYFQITGASAAGVVSAVAYLGPRAIDTFFESNAVNGTSA